MIYGMVKIKKILQYVISHLNLITVFNEWNSQHVAYWKFGKFQKVIFHPFFLIIFCLFNNNNNSTSLKYENMILDPFRTVRFTPNITCTINTNVSSLFLFFWGGRGDLFRLSFNFPFGIFRLSFFLLVLLDLYSRKYGIFLAQVWKRKYQTF